VCLLLLPINMAEGGGGGRKKEEKELL